MRVFVVLTMLFCVGLSGCLFATPKPMHMEHPELTAADEEEIMICRKERPSGSHIEKMVCVPMPMLAPGFVFDPRRDVAVMRPSST